MDTLIIFLVMCATIIGPTLIVIAVLLGIPIALYILSRRRTLTAKICILTACGMLVLPVISELIAVATLLVLFYLYGQG